MEKHYDVIIVGTGAGGGTLAYRLAQSGKRILLLERGPFMPREKENWDVKTVFNTNRYHNDEVWYDRDGNALHPGMSYFVGGNTKVDGAALFRLRERDFEEYTHKDGVSPAWPLKYKDFEPYYTQAEELYQVHGQQGEDPTEPPRSRDYFYPAVSHELRIQEVTETLKGKGLRPYHTPVGLRLNEAQRYLSECIRCNIGEDTKTVGVGLFPGDGDIDQPYWYVTPWPYPDPANLPELSLGQWATDGWVGAILQADQVADPTSKTAQKQIKTFLDQAIQASETLVKG